MFGVVGVRPWSGARVGFCHVHSEIVVLEPPCGSCDHVNGQPDWKKWKNISNDRRANEEFVPDGEVLGFISFFLEEGLMIR